MMGKQEGGSWAAGLAPSRAEALLFVDELARRGLYERRDVRFERVQDWQIVDEMPFDRGFSQDEIAWFCGWGG